jgi:ferredoxin-NADP reductase
MLVKKYKSQVISIKNPFSDIYTIEFRSLNGRYKYNPGQFLHLALDFDYDGSGQWPESRCFSMQSSPSEENIRITYSVKGSFTRQMKDDLKIGSEVWLKLPFGNLFNQPHNKENTVFIAGGTGITPFLSLFIDPSFKEYINPSIYIGFRSHSFNIYKEELSLIDKILSHQKSKLTISYEDQHGQLDIEKIYMENGSTNDYFLSGPPIMLKSFQNSLMKKNFPKEKILTDSWE